MGTRTRPYYIYDYYRDHPHAYGDKARENEFDTWFSGSSPRVWGQVGGFYQLILDTGIIPTRMGTRIGFGGKSTTV